MCGGTSLFLLYTGEEPELRTNLGHRLGSDQQGATISPDR